MQFPESWLRSFCNPDLTTQQLADLLTMAGLEVEELDPWPRRLPAWWLGMCWKSASTPMRTA